MDAALNFFSQTWVMVLMGVLLLSLIGLLLYLRKQAGED